MTTRLDTRQQPEGRPLDDPQRADDRQADARQTARWQTDGRTVDRVGIIGAGAMGRGIAEAALRGGLPVTLCDTTEAALVAARATIERGLRKSVDKGTLAADRVDPTLALLTTTGALSDLTGHPLVIEAVPELVDLKHRVLGAAEALLDEQAVLASNTSSIPISVLAGRLQRPERFLGLHFFIPVPRMDLVEVIPSLATAPEVTTLAREVAADRLGKRPVVVGDSPGFLVNRLLVPYIIAGVRMFEAGYASAEDIDTAMRLGAGHPMGPLELCDLIGLDIIRDAGDAIWAETRDPAAVVPGILRRMCDLGRLGRKSGHGFHDYSGG